MNLNNRSRHINIILLVIILFSANPLSSYCDDINMAEKMTIMNHISQLVRGAYVDSISAVELYDGAIKGMVDKLDPHSSYMPPQTANDFTEQIRGDFQGIGITFGIYNEKITVIEAIDGGPSMRAGLRSRDKIVKIDGEDVIGVDNDKVKDLLRGKKGSNVVIHVERPGEDDLLRIKIVRDEINIDSVSHAYMLDETTGYLNLTRFTLKTQADVARALTRLGKQGMKRLIFDLRNNSGGSLNDAVRVVDYFISDGLIVETKGKRARDNEQWLARKETLFPDIPMIVLINHGSASASEIVAGALQDHDRALIVGQTSFGKGLVMNQFPIQTQTRDLGSMMLSVARYHTPSGRLIQRPYDNGKAEYIMEGLDDVDMNAADSSKVDQPVFFTDLNRKVYSGGGITPDIMLDRLPNLNSLEASIRGASLMFEFADEYLTRNPDVPEDFMDYLNNYTIPENEIQKFKEFVIGKDISIESPLNFDEELKKFVKKFELSEEAADVIKESLKKENISISNDLFEKSIPFIQREMKQEIARMIWDSEARYRIWHEEDTELISALGYFDDAEELLSRRVAMSRVQTDDAR